MDLSAFTLQEIVVERPRYTKDTSGGGKQEFFQVSDKPLVCSIQSISGGSPYYFGQRQTVNSHQIYFDQDPAAQRGDRLKDQDGNYYVVNLIENIAGRSEVWVVEATQQNKSAGL